MKSLLFDLTNKNIKKSIEKKELQLSFRQKASHYEIVLWMLFLSIIIPTVLFVMAYFNDKTISINFSILWISIFLFTLAVIYYFIQKNRLKLIVIKTRLTREQIGDVIDEICKKLNWSKWRNRKNLIVLKTPEEFWSFFAAEQITILFNDYGILANSIRDLDAQRKAFGEVGKNAENIRKIRNEIEKAERQIFFDNKQNV